MCVCVRAHMQWRVREVEWLCVCVRARTCMCWCVLVCARENVSMMYDRHALDLP